MADLGDLCARAVEAALEGEAVEAYAAEGRHLDVRARGGEVEALTFAETRGLGVRVIDGGRLGYAYAADPSPREIPDLVASARESARFSEPEPANALPSLGPVEPLDGLFDPGLAAADPEEKVRIALELERAAVAAVPEVRKVESASYGDAVARVAIASTAGGPLEMERTDCWVSVVALAERDGETQSGFDFGLARSLDALDWARTARSAALRGARLLGGVKPPTERLPVVLDPAAAAAFLSVLAGAVSGEAVLKGRSPLAPLVGERVGSDRVTLVDDGRLLAGPEASPFDDEGVPTGRTAVIEDGVLRGFLHNTLTAAKSGAVSTGNAGRASYRTLPGVGATNLFLVPGPADPEEVLRLAGHAVYVQEVTGLHSGASSVSGDFSVGAAGLRVENGTFGEPLREMTIASTLLDVLRGVTALGSDLRFFPFGGSMGAPTVLVGEMTVAGS